MTEVILRYKHALQTEGFPWGVGMGGDLGKPAQSSTLIRRFTVRFLDKPMIHSFFKWTIKTLIRLCLFQSFFGTHVRRYVFSRCASMTITTVLTFLNLFGLQECLVNWLILLPITVDHFDNLFKLHIRRSGFMICDGQD